MAYIGRRAGGDVWRRGTEVAAGTGDGREDRRSRTTNV